MKKFNVQYYKIHQILSRIQIKDNIRIVVLSDLHGASYGNQNQGLVKMVRGLKPDLIVAAGDMITDRKHSDTKDVIHLLQELAFSYPVFYGNGNHETGMKLGNKPEQREMFLGYQEKLLQAGVKFLENTKTEITIKEFTMKIYGLEAGLEYYKRFCCKKMQKEEMESLLGISDANCCNILIAHNPMDFSAYVQWGANLVLSGHLHGGFMRLPFVGGVISPQMHLFPKYDKGLFREKSTTMVVSAGIGNHFPPPRIWNPREIVVVDLE